MSQVRQARRDRLGRRMVEHVVHHLRAGDAVLKLQPQPREALGRLVGHQQRGDERKERARVGMMQRDAPAAVEDHGADGEAGERVGDRPRHGGARRHAVRAALDLAHGRFHAAAHFVFEVERLDDARALHGLLHRLHDLRRAGVPADHELADAPDRLVEQQRGDRERHERDEREDRLLHEHDDDEAQQRENVAARGRDDRLQRVAHAVGRIDEARDEVARMTVVEEAHVLPQQVVEQTALGVGDDRIADARERDRCEEGDEAPQDEETEDEPRHEAQVAEPLALHDPVENGLQQVGGIGGGRGADAQQGEREDVGAHVAAAVLAEQPPEHVPGFRVQDRLARLGVLHHHRTGLARRRSGDKLGGAWVRKAPQGAAAAARGPAQADGSDFLGRDISLTRRDRRMPRRSLSAPSFCRKARNSSRFSCTEAIT